MIDPSFWREKRVFLTGHTGFKGSWLSLWLQNLGVVLRGYALRPRTRHSLFEVANVSQNMESVFGDIRDLDQLKKSLLDFDPDILIHMAAQPLVRLSYRDPIETYSTNVMGTVNVLEAARTCPRLGAIISVTTDKCYENREWVWGYREEDPVGGHDPYSSSKGCAELVTSAYRRSFMQYQGIGLVSARAGNVIGGGDWSEDRLIPDVLYAFERERPAVIRNPKSTRPWQHVLEPLSGYLVLAQRLYDAPRDFVGGWNFGPGDDDVRSVNWVLERMVELWGDGASWELDAAHHPHEAHYLKLDISKARCKLSWKPTWCLDDALDRTVAWHRAWLQRQDMQARCVEEIDQYTEDMSRERN